MGTKVVHAGLRIFFVLAVMVAAAVWAAPRLGLSRTPHAGGAAFPGVNGQIAFTSHRDNNDEIYKMNADGTVQTRLTNNSAADQYPAWSSNGAKIAFQSDRSTTAGKFDIWVMDANGGNPTRLTNDSAIDRYPDWSPDGKYVAFTRGPDGNCQIYRINADGTGGLTNLTQYAGAATNANSAWSPDGSLIAFASDRSTGYLQIYVMNANGTGQTPLTSNPNVNDWYPSWSPDGNYIAFTSDRDGNEEVYRMPAGGGVQTNLTNNAALDAAPSWSPDGSKIAFTSDRDGNREIYTMNAANGGSPMNLTNNAAGDNVADWQRLIGVGGIAELPDIAGIAGDQAARPEDASGWSSGTYAAVAGVGGLALAALAAGGWYARKRWIR